LLPVEKWRYCIAQHAAITANNVYESVVRPARDFNAFWLGFSRSTREPEAALSNLCAVHQRKGNRAV
jgi:hypothetical protein